MFFLRDFFNFAEADGLAARILADPPGLVVVSGLDARPESVGFLPSGRGMIFRSLWEELLGSIGSEPGATGKKRCEVVTSGIEELRPPRSYARQVNIARVEPPLTYARRVADAIKKRPALLLIDRLDDETVPLAFEAALSGLRVLAQMDTILRGAGLARYFVDMGVPAEQLTGLRWSIAVRRVAALCQHCRQPIADPETITMLLPPGRPPNHSLETFYHAGDRGCEICRGSGRSGDLGLVDIFRVDAPPPALFARPSLLSMPHSARILAGRGQLAVEDAIQLEADEMRQMVGLVSRLEHSLAESRSGSAAQAAELEAANRVLRHRTQVLFSLEEISQELTGSGSLAELGEKVCNRARDLCGAQRVVLYYLQTPQVVTPLAVLGWKPGLLPSQLSPGEVFGSQFRAETLPYNRCPPGIPSDLSELKSLRAGLAVPLLAQTQLVGLMVVHSTHKASFAPGEVALLQTFANQAALALQRAGLIGQLRLKIELLERAQAELAHKERLERELELAREVQQSMLPRAFPVVMGCTFVAYNQPARQVGGDFYDVIALPEGRVGLVIADVSDKGMPAALYMALTRSLLRAEARQTFSPASVLRQVNRLLLDLGDPRMFVTVFYAALDPVTRHLVYARAGHNRPLLLRSGVVSELRGRGMPLGTFDDATLVLTEEELTLQSGDRLVLYTDGLTDAVSPAEQMFGLDGLGALLQCHAQQPASSLCEAIFSDLADFRGTAEPFDDMALLVLEV